MQNNKPLMVALSKLVSTNQPDLVLFVGEAFLVGNDGVDQLQVGTNLCIMHRALNMYFFRRMGGGRRMGSRIVAPISMAMFTYTPWTPSFFPSLSYRWSPPIFFLKRTGN